MSNINLVTTPAAGPGGAFTAANASTRTPSKTLGQEDFLQILVAQMKSQDPTNPKGNDDFISQMAQFSALEQSKSSQKDMAVLRANEMIGRTVELDMGKGKDKVEGVISEIQFSDGVPKIVVGGTQYDFSKVTRIVPTATYNPAVTNI